MKESWERCKSGTPANVWVNGRGLLQSHPGLAAQPQHAAAKDKHRGRKPPSRRAVGGLSSREQRVGTHEGRAGLPPFLNCHGGRDPQPSGERHLGTQHKVNGAHGSATLFLNSIHQKMFKNLCT